MYAKGLSEKFRVLPQKGVVDVKGQIVSDSVCLPLWIRGDEGLSDFFDSLTVLWGLSVFEEGDLAQGNRP